MNTFEYIYLSIIIININDIDKYKKNVNCRNLWKYPTITFTKFVNELIKNDYLMIDKHHFTPQTTESFNIKIVNSKSIKCYDIHNIDYKYIETLYNKKIPDNILNKKFGHETSIKSKFDKKFVYDVNMDYIEYGIDTQYYYNDDLKKKVYNFYKQDWVFFKKMGIDYNFL